MLRVCAILLACAVSPGVSLAVCPEPAPERAETLADLTTALKTSSSAEEGEAAADALWQIWLTAPDTRAQALLDQAMQRRLLYNYEEAERSLDDLIAYCPDYVEAYNQRAFVRFLRDRLDESLADIDTVLARVPGHFGALSGQAQIFLRQGRSDLAQNALRLAVDAHPWLPERVYLLKEPSDRI